LYCSNVYLLKINRKPIISESPNQKYRKFINKFINNKNSKLFGIVLVVIDSAMNEETVTIIGFDKLNIICESDLIFPAARLAEHET